MYHSYASIPICSNDTSAFIKTHKWFLESPGFCSLKIFRCWYILLIDTWHVTISFRTVGTSLIFLMPWKGIWCSHLRKTHWWYLWKVSKYTFCFSLLSAGIALFLSFSVKSSGTTFSITELAGMIDPDPLKWLTGVWKSQYSAHTIAPCWKKYLVDILYNWYF